MPVYPNAPLVLVALEVRYPELVEPVDTRGLRKAVRDLLPIPGNVTQQTITFGAAPPVIDQQRFPRLVSRDGTTALVVSQQSLVVETTTYDGYDQYREIVEQVIRAVADVQSPDGIQRVGLRFIDEIRVPGVTEPPGNWTEWIVEGLLVPLAPDVTVGSEHFRPRTWQGEAVYDAGAGYAVKLRYGPQVGHAVPPNGPTRRLKPPEAGLFFLLDSDGSWTPQDGVPEFSPDRVLDACDTVHEPLSALFKAVGTQRLVDEVFMETGGRQ